MTATEHKYRVGEYVVYHGSLSRQHGLAEVLVVHEDSLMLESCYGVLLSHVRLSSVTPEVDWEAAK